MSKAINRNRFLTPGGYARRLLDLMQESWGIAPAHLLDGTGLDESAIQAQDCRLPFETIVSLFDRAYGCVAADDLGLRYGARLKLNAHGLLGEAVLTSRDLEAAMALFYNNVGLIAPFLLLHQEERRHNRVLVFELISHPQPISTAMIFDILLLSTFNILKLVLGERTRELVFHFAHPAPSYADAYQQYFDGHVQFNASSYGVSIPREFLQTPVNPHTEADKQHDVLLEEIADSIQRVHAPSAFVDAVREYLRKNGTPLPRMASVAEAFHMSARTFRNRLRRDNTSFQNLLDQERQQQAMGFLCESNKPVKEIAYMLGFQESSNFSRVFKKWTGLTPLDYRRRHRPHLAK